MNYKDYIGIILSEVGILYFTLWGVWSFGNYGVPFSHPLGFVKYLGGLI